MQTAFLIPVSGCPRNPQDKASLPEAGAEMPLTSYWKRRILFGEVVIGSPAVKKTESKKIKEKEDYDYGD